MWPFDRKKQAIAKEQEMEPPVAIGQRFKYLGIEMVCIRHYEFPYDFKVVVGEYINNHGDLKREVFCPIDWASLESEMAR